MKLRFAIAWQNYRVGAVIDPPAMLAGQYLALRVLGRPVVVPVPEPVVMVHEPEPEPETSTAVSQRPRRRAKGEES